MDMPETEGRGLALYSYRAWVLPYRTREDHQDDQIGTIGASQIRSYVVSREFLAYPPPSPFKYTPPLPTRLLGLNPFVTTLMAKTTLERRPDYSDIAFDDEAKVTLQRAEYLLELCEVETPSSWRDLARPPLGNTLSQGPVDPSLQRRRYQATKDNPIAPPPQWSTSSPSKWAHSAEADLTLGGIAALTMQEHLDDEGCGCDGATLDELEAKLERFEAGCEAQRTAVLVECTRIIERHFSADCAKRGFALAMRSLRSTAKHAADDELAAKQEMQEKQDERSRQHRDKIIDAINELGY